ncbi:hypothetical protein CGRA01v4_07624 [Colletotrichum graminicola]|nr:hypothetical protein CGRA01v4_07624 [Colletotrichum graminicola]
MLLGSSIWACTKGGSCCFSCPALLHHPVQSRCTCMLCCAIITQIPHDAAEGGDSAARPRRIAREPPL